MKSEKTQEKLKINSRILAKNSKGGNLRLLQIAPKTLKKRACSNHYLNFTFAGWCHARVSVGFDECLDAPRTSAQFQQLVQDAYLGWMEPIQRTVDLSRSFENLSGTCLKYITCRSGFFSPVIGHRQQMNLADSWVKKKNPWV